jgi:hypothetical protein
MKTFDELETEALKDQGKTVTIGTTDLEFVPMTSPLLYFFDGSQVSRELAKKIYEEDIDEQVFRKKHGKIA